MFIKVFDIGLIGKRRGKEIEVLLKLSILMKKMKKIGMVFMILWIVI